MWINGAIKGFPYMVILTAQRIAYVWLWHGWSGVTSRQIWRFGHKSSRRDYFTRCREGLWQGGEELSFFFFFFVLQKFGFNRDLITLHQPSCLRPHKWTPVCPISPLSRNQAGLPSFPPLICHSYGASRHLVTSGFEGITRAGKVQCMLKTSFYTCLIWLPLFLWFYISSSNLGLIQAINLTSTRANFFPSILWPKIYARPFSLSNMLQVDLNIWWRILQIQSNDFFQKMSLLSLRSVN